MSNNYAYSDFEDFELYRAPVETAERAHQRRKNKEKTKVLKLLLCLLGAVLLIEGIIYLVVIPCLNEVQVTFSGLKTLQASELGRTLSLRCGTQWIGFDIALAASQIASYGSVESVSVEKRFPNRIFVTVKERVPVAISFVQIEGKTVSVQIDKNGVLFKSNAASASSSVPLITGLELDSLGDGVRVNTKFRSLLEQIAEIQKTNAVYFSAISEIRVLPKEYDNYELTLYPLHSKTRVLTDRNLSEKTLQYMMVVLDVINSIEPDVNEVDLRYGSVSYKMNL